MNNSYIIEKTASALVFKENGQLEIVMPVYDSEEENVPIQTQLLSAIAMLLSIGDEDFINCVWDKWSIIISKENPPMPTKEEILDLLKEVTIEQNISTIINAFCILLSGWKDYQILSFIKNYAKT